MTCESLADVLLPPQLCEHLPTHAGQLSCMLQCTCMTVIRLQSCHRLSAVSARIPYDGLRCGRVAAAPWTVAVLGKLMSRHPNPQRLNNNMWRLCVTLRNAGIELLLAVQGLLSRLWHWLWLFAALHMYHELNVWISMACLFMEAPAHRQF